MALNEDESESGSEGEADHMQHLTDRYVALREQRKSQLANFREAQQQHAYISRLQRSAVEADQKFMDLARELLSDNPRLSQLHRLFKTMQNTRIECQDAEQQLRETVDNLYHGQNELALQEDRFYKTALGAWEVTLESDSSQSSDSDDSYLLGITGDRPEITHPRYQKLCAAFAELQLAEELLANTQMKRAALLVRKQKETFTEDNFPILESFGSAGKKRALQLRKRDLDDLKQLEEYDALEKEARQGIEQYTESFKVLLKECRESNVLPPSSKFHQDQPALDLSRRDERLAPIPSELNDEEVNLAHPLFPLLLSNPTHLLHKFPQTAMQSLKMALQLPTTAPIRPIQVREAAREANIHFLLSQPGSQPDPEDKSDYINRWLLHKLHHSAMEAELLFETFQSKLKILDIDRWQQDVLRFWWRDDAVDVPAEDMADNGTNKAANSSASPAEFGTASEPGCSELEDLTYLDETDSLLYCHSDPGQLERLKDWNPNDLWK
ncbi:hypothetical protein F4777DRAFT_589692 [Nemania sp. FL0916]|nr:hypothetical protein F4777DRAFT_589692 [Nemania sp. FL0916]